MLIAGTRLSLACCVCLFALRSSVFHALSLKSLCIGQNSYQGRLKFDLRCCFTADLFFNPAKLGRVNHSRVGEPHLRGLAAPQEGNVIHRSRSTCCFRDHGFDGDMRIMERMVGDLIALFGSVKDAIREHW